MEGKGALRYGRKSLLSDGCKSCGGVLEEAGFPGGSGYIPHGNSPIGRCGPSGLPLQKRTVPSVIPSGGFPG